MPNRMDLTRFASDSVNSRFQLAVMIRYGSATFYFRFFFSMACSRRTAFTFCDNVQVVAIKIFSKPRPSRQTWLIDARKVLLWIFV